MLAFLLLPSLAVASSTRIGCISTADDTSTTDSWTVNFSRDGWLILVSTTPQETASGWLELQIAGGAGGARGRGSVSGGEAGSDGADGSVE